MVEFNEGIGYLYCSMVYRICFLVFSAHSICNQVVFGRWA